MLGYLLKRCTLIEIPSLKSNKSQIENIRSRYTPFKKYSYRLYNRQLKATKIRTHLQQSLKNLIFL